ncbi:MAG: PAS domain-containing protein, partial [Bacteroidota bacterium]
MKVSDLDPDYPMDIWPQFWNDFRKQKFMEFNSTNQRKDGSTYPVNVRLYYTIYRGTEYMIAYTKNIEEKLKKEKELELFYLTLNQSQDMILWCLKDGSIRFQNNRILEKLRYDKATFNELKLQDIVKDLPFEQLWERENISHETEVTLRGKNRDSIHALARVERVEHLGESLMCIVMSDQTERRRREQELQQALVEISNLKERLETENTYLQEE